MHGALGSGLLASRLVPREWASGVACGELFVVAMVTRCLYSFDLQGVEFYRSFAAEHVD